MQCVPLKVHFWSQSNAVVAVHKVPQPSRPVSVDTRRVRSLWEVVHFKVVTHSELEGLSRVTCPTPASLESQALWRFQAKFLRGLELHTFLEHFAMRVCSRDIQKLKHNTKHRLGKAAGEPRYSHPKNFRVQGSSTPTPPIQEASDGHSSPPFASPSLFLYFWHSNR